MGKPLTKTTIVELANDLIYETEYQKNVRDCKALRKLKQTEKLSDAWYRGFLHRFSDELTRSAIKIKDVKRNTWVTKDNFLNMYTNVYETMVEAGVAEKLEQEIQHEEGLPTKFKLTKPEFLLFVDETGCNTNQLNDGRVGGELFVLPKNDNEAGAPTGSTTELHFTVLGFVSGTGEPVMCAIIFKSDQKISEIPISWKTGIDIMVDDVDDHNKVMAGGPNCTYLGKTVPCFYGTSPKASITSTMLAKMLEFIDRLNVFDRSIAHPFLLLDGHHSRMSLPFLQYVNDPSHKWFCCFGVPYATHIWQVGDASALNGAFKIHLTKAKRKYIEKRGSPRFEPSDIVPLVNYAFPKSFGNTKSAAKVVAERGWNPLNYNLIKLIPGANDVVDLTTTTTSSTVNSCPEVNLKYGAGNKYLDLLIEEGKKDDGRKRKFEMIKSQQKTKADKIEHIKKLTKVSSATLAANNHYVLDENIRDLVYAKHQAEEAAQAAASERRRAAEEKKTENLNKALEKFKICPNGLTVPEMKALVVAATNTTDSPVKSRKADLQAQLYREPRYGRVQAMANNLTLTSTSNNESVADAAAEGLLALFGNPTDTTPV
jgi:hypothetical protein